MASRQCVFVALLATLLLSCALASELPPPAVRDYIEEHFVMKPLPVDANVQPRPYSDNYRPVVFMHGLGDSGSNPGMQSLAKSVMSRYPGSYAVSVSVADDSSSYTTPIKDQVTEFARVVAADPKLQHGFNLVGLSQGGLIARTYVQLYNNPPVYNLISINGVQNGVGKCPSSIPEFICSFFTSDPYGAGFSFSGYWKDVTNKAKYLKESPFLADVNNEKDQKSDAYKSTMLSLNKYVLIMALNDTTVYPKESEQHGFYKWGDVKSVETLHDTEAYQGDWIGLKTLDQQGKIDLLQFEGDHLKFTQDFWNNIILPYFDNTIA